MYRNLLLPTLALAALPLMACGGSSDQDYYDGTASSALGAANNQATCATCHAMDDSNGYSGSSFKNIAYLENYKGGGAPTLLAATNACVTGWMGGTALTADSEGYVALKSFMEGLSDAAVTTPNPLMPEVLADLPAYEAAYGGGDATAGEAAWGTYCASCHDTALTVGPGTAPAVAGISAQTAGEIAQKVRTAGPPPSSGADMMAGIDLTPGPMPFFEMSELSADDLKNIVAYIKK
jgi:cytochrome c553